MRSAKAGDRRDKEEERDEGGGEECEEQFLLCYHGDDGRGAYVEPILEIRLRLGLGFSRKGICKRMSKRISDSRIDRTISEGGRWAVGGGR